MQSINVIAMADTDCSVGNVGCLTLQPLQRQPLQRLGAAVLPLSKTGRCIRMLGTAPSVACGDIGYLRNSLGQGRIFDTDLIDQKYEIEEDDCDRDDKHPVDQGKALCSRR